MTSRFIYLNISIYIYIYIYIYSHTHTHVYKRKMFSKSRRHIILHMQKRMTLFNVIIKIFIFLIKYYQVIEMVQTH